MSSKSPQTAGDSDAKSSKHQQQQQQQHLYAAPQAQQLQHPGPQEYSDPSGVDPQMHNMQSYDIYNMYGQGHQDPYASHHNPYMAQQDPRYLQGMGGMDNSFGGHNTLALPYLSHPEHHTGQSSDYNQSSHRPHATHHHSNLHHPYADTNSSSGNSSRRKGNRNQQQQHIQQQTQSQHVQHHPDQFNSYMDPSHQSHLDHHQMYQHHQDTMYHGGVHHTSLHLEHGGFGDPTVQEFDPITGAPIPMAPPPTAPAPPAVIERVSTSAHLASSIVAVDNGKGAKVYKCPRPLCTKVYKNPNGLKYHLDRGACEVDHDVMEATTGISLHTDDPTALFNLQQQAQQALHNGGYEGFPVGPDGNPIPGAPGGRDAVAGGGPAGGPPQNLAAAAALMASDDSLKIVHRPYGCKIAGCAKRYQNLNGLKYHAKTAHPGLDFKSEVYVLYPF
ncbi:hypothetical protein HDU79_007731 [Rhizoclosmatium sp. JEL0117]|nr:hypothetical protein HDU79_007731 [Rhizoclosmatium sp. JEL0117]